jgi:hypothetical protein
MIPAMTPEASGAPEANAIPKHKGRATIDTTIEDRASLRHDFNSSIRRNSFKQFLQKKRDESDYALGGLINS